MRYFLLLVLFVGFPSHADYLSFGFSMGYPAAQLQGCTVLSDPRTNSIRCLTKNVPVADQRFSDFQIGYTEAAGVCNIQATGTFDTKQDALALKRSYAGIADEITKELGQSKSSFGDMESSYWTSPSDYFQNSRLKSRSLASKSWQKDGIGGLAPQVSRIVLTAMAIDEEKANLTLSVWFENNWRCFRPEISPTARVLKFETADLGIERLGQGVARLTQTEIAPEVYWIEVVNVRPSPEARFSNGAMQSQQFFSLIGTCAAWQAGKSLGGRIFSFTPLKRFAGELLAFIPVDVSSTEIELKTGGTLRELTQQELARSREFCEMLPSQLKASIAPGRN